MKKQTNFSNDFYNLRYRRLYLDNEHAAKQVRNEIRQHPTTILLLGSELRQGPYYVSPRFGDAIWDAFKAYYSGQLTGLIPDLPFLKGFK